MPYRFALSREQRSTLPLVNSFLLRDCKNGMHFLPRIVYNLDLYLVFSSSFFFSLFFFPRKRKSRGFRDAVSIADQSWRNLCICDLPSPSFPSRDEPRYLHVCKFQLRRSLATPTFPVDPSPTSAPCSLAMLARCTAPSLTYSWVYGTINPLRDSIITEAIKHLNV